MVMGCLDNGSIHPSVVGSEVCGSFAPALPQKVVKMLKAWIRFKPFSMWHLLCPLTGHIGKEPGTILLILMAHLSKQFFTNQQ